jgi:hypothetical protein
MSRRIGMNSFEKGEIWMARASSCRKRKAESLIDQTVCWRISDVVDLVISLVKLAGSPSIRPPDIVFDEILSSCHIGREDRSRDFRQIHPHTDVARFPVSYTLPVSDEPPRSPQKMQRCSEFTPRVHSMHVPFRHMIGTLVLLPSLLRNRQRWECLG